MITAAKKMAGFVVTERFDHFKIYKAKFDMLSDTVRYYEELGVADEIEVLDFLKVSHELEIATG